MKLRLLSTILIALALTSCGGGSSPKQVNEQESTTEPLPAFEINVHHINLAVENQPIDITLVANEGHSITSSELSVDLAIPMEISKLSETEYTLLVPSVYKEQLLNITTTATNNDGETLSTNSSVELKYNKPPKTTLLTPTTVDDSAPFLLEFNVEDEHSLQNLTLKTTQAGVDITQVTGTSFQITLLETFMENRLVVSADASDEYQATSKQTFYIDFPRPYLSFYLTDGDNALLNDRTSLRLMVNNLPESQTVSHINWSQKSGPTIAFEPTNNKVLYFTTPTTYSPIPIVLEAKVILSDESVLTIEHSITLIEDKAYTLTAIDPELVQEKLEATQRNDTDANNDGLPDILTIEDGIAYVQLQNSDGSYQEKQRVGEITFHQWLRNGPVPEMQMPLPENLGVNKKSISLMDVDNDGIKDIVFTGGIHYPLSAITDPIAGWLKGISPLKYYGDFMSVGLGYSVMQSFVDINGDDYIDWLYYDAYYELDGPFINLSYGVPQNTLGAGSLPWIPRYMRLYDSANGFVNDSSNFIALQLYTTQQAWEYGTGDTSNYERITVHEFLPNIGFQTNYSFLLDERTRYVHFIDVTDNDTRDIVIKTSDNSYYSVEPEQK
ncbi:FG-GAP repeat domain-containing protein [Colwelliaceae bacterium 6471]